MMLKNICPNCINLQKKHKPPSICGKSYQISRVMLCGGGTVLKNDGAVKGAVRWVRWVRYGGYGGYGTGGTVGTVRGVRYGGYATTVPTVPSYRTHRTSRTVPTYPPYRTHRTHRTVPTVPTVPYPPYPPYRTHRKCHMYLPVLNHQKTCFSFLLKLDKVNPISQTSKKKDGSAPFIKPGLGSDCKPPCHPSRW